MKKLYNSLIYIFALVIIIYLPFQSLLEQALIAKGLSSGVSYWIGNWYEIVIGVLLVILFINIVRGKTTCPPLAENLNTSHNVRRIKEQWPAILLCLLGLISIAFIASTRSRGIEGFKFDLLPVVIFLIVAVSGLTKIQKAKLFNTYLVVALVLAAWALLERFLPLGYWSHLGLTNFGYGQFGFGRFSFGPIYQSASFIGGPNQLASYLLLAVFILLYRVSSSGFGLSSSGGGARPGDPLIVDSRFHGNDKKSTGYKFVMQYFSILILVLAIFFSFSRSAWIGLAVGLLVYAIFYAKKSSRNLFIATAIGAVIILAVLFKYSPAVKDVLLHTGGGDTASSTSSHVTALSTTLSELKARVHNPVQLIFGSGLGSAGPLVLKYGNGIIPESWYAQVLFELGIFGLLGWLTFIIQLLSKSYRYHPELFLSIIAVSVTALFLHTWADNPALAITLFILAGASKLQNDQFSIMRQLKE